MGSVEQKTERAFAAYMDVLETAEFLRAATAEQLEWLELTHAWFRVLELLHRAGPRTKTDLRLKLRCTKEAMHDLILRLEAKGWARRVKKGPREVWVRLTREGKKFVEEILPKHKKLVREQMRVLDGRELENLSRLCQKLRQDDLYRRVKTIMMRGEYENE